MTERRSTPTWHQALGYAMTGQRLDALDALDGLDPLDGQDRLNLPVLARTLLDLQRARQVVLASSVVERHHVPADLRAGIGPAQFWAALSELTMLVNRSQPTRPSPVIADRPLTPEERRLTDETPPHHGSS
jgi:hypothetical protein